MRKLFGTCWVLNKCWLMINVLIHTIPFHPQVIKPESCVPCGKRIKFGKPSLKCRDCRVVSHPECRDRCPLPCIPTLIGTPVKIGEVCMTCGSPPCVMTLLAFKNFCVQTLQSVQPLVTPWTVVCQAPLSMGILQERRLEWVARGSSQPSDRPCMVGGFFTSEPPEKPFKSLWSFFSKIIDAMYISSLK